MKMVHITKTAEGSYTIVDATRAEPGFAPTSSARSEDELRTALEKFGGTGMAIDNAVAEVNRTGNALLKL